MHSDSSELLLASRRLRQLVSLGPRRRVLQPVAAIQLRLVLFLPLHAPILEPDLDLALGQTQGVGDLDAPPASQVAVEVELLLELQGLVPGVRLPATFPLCKVTPKEDVQ